MAPITAGKLAHWDPVAVFNLDLNSDVFRCLGTNKHGEDCGNPVKHDDVRTNVGRCIAVLSRMSPQKITMDHLKEMAQWRLCKGCHRGNAEQVNAKTYAWYMKLQRFITHGVPKHQPISNAQAAREQTTTAQAAEALSLRLTKELQKAQVRLADKESEGDELERKCEDVKTKNKLLKLENARLTAQIAKFEHEHRQSVQNQRDECNRANERTARLKEQLTARNAQIQHVKKRARLRNVLHMSVSRGLQMKIATAEKKSTQLLDQLHKGQSVIDYKSTKIENLTYQLREQETSHTEELDDLHSQLDTTKAELIVAKGLATTKGNRLNQQIAASASVDARLNAELDVWQRRCNEASADKETLLDQQKKIQLTMCAKDSKLQTIEVGYDVSVLKSYAHHHVAENYFAPKTPQRQERSLYSGIHSASRYTDSETFRYAESFRSFKL